MNAGFIIICCISAIRISAFDSVPPPIIAANRLAPDTVVKPKANVGQLQFGKISNATFSHNTSRGKVYLLSPDSMPCLVPNSESVIPMPVYRPRMRAFRMPNTLPPDKNDKDNKMP